MASTAGVKMGSGVMGKLGRAWVLVQGWLVGWLDGGHVGFMSRKGPKVGQGMLDFVEDLRYNDFSVVII